MHTKLIPLRRSYFAPLSLAYALLMLPLTITPTGAASPIGKLEQGRFGNATRPRMMTQTVEEHEAYKVPPLTIELWAKVDDKSNYNILIANEMKESATHWELYTAAGTGKLCALLSGYTPHDLRSDHVVTDGNWHYVVMTFDGHEVVLFVDAKLVLQQSVIRNDRKEIIPGALMIGHAIARDHSLGCNGRIDEVRLSSVLRDISTVPTKPFEADNDTIGLWHFDELDKDSLALDYSSFDNPIMNPPEFKSLDERDAFEFQPGPSPWDSEAENLDLLPGSVDIPHGAPVMSLDGEWEMAEGGNSEQRLNGAWKDSIPVEVPGSVHGGLLKANKIPDPYTRKNEPIARKQSHKTWWFKRTFDRPPGKGSAELHFAGVGIKCTVWLNGRELGSHEGMFGGPDFDITNLLEDENSLIVRIDPAPHLPGPGPLNSFFENMNVGWAQTVTFNNVWGWHYCSIPSLGIWQPVRIVRQPRVRMTTPFVRTVDASEGTIEISADFKGPEAGWSGKLQGCIRPENFSGESYYFEYDFSSVKSDESFHAGLKIPNPHLWWPVDLGKANLYRLEITFVPKGPDPEIDSDSIVFGIRTIEMGPANGEANKDHYNWTFIINGRPTFVKGTGWCTMDPLLDFSRARYERLISLAQDQHVQMLRAWGSGMPETDAFYDLCDRYGIMVMQEWPTAWNSHNSQPYDVLEDTVARNTLRLRNHPSLAMWGGGNESDKPFGKAIDMMGRYAHELDGTRPFHRGEPWGGSAHDYTSDWGAKPMDHNLTYKQMFIGEFGMNSVPNYDSVMRYLPEEEQKAWPPTPDGTFALHTPVFNTKGGLERLQQFSQYFVDGDTMEEFIFGSQLAQATVLRSTIELNRANWPESTGVLHYKLNDNYPAASWATVDWYGAPKIAYYIVQDAMAPLMATVSLPSFQTKGKAIEMPVYVVDDVEELAGTTWQVLVRAYDQRLQIIKEQEYSGQQADERVVSVGKFTLQAEQTDTSPLLFVVELIKDGTLAHRNYYWSQFEAEPDSMLKLAPTRLEMKVAGNVATVTNSGDVPAIGAHVLHPGHLDTFTVSDNYFWLEAGESKEIVVSNPEDLTVGAWNAR
ncbi:glycosyl hydrolase 2 galactose-binding domain-containing protein [Bythopirellula polymerisocia]|uniref:beta-mannosidase n=1 Tax=Bythopirellula polymerisocia TaxID=2528003 RepID=A0A5C6CD52_9BACT|nr:LamG-like jellyroll fold domain-containing protein [Bythopirellula polymerisocia]TWU21371.1 Exo-beta-D-glucosaminidase precursor [Bythopirellula polymerisocia]